MDDITSFLIVCPMVFLAGFIDAIGGGGGLISLPAYISSFLWVRIFRKFEPVEVKEEGIIEETSGWTNIFIYPGYKFKMVDKLITNFHLPESTLIMLVSALSSKENVLNAYETAVKERYRFFSFGDAMIVK